MLTIKNNLMAINASRHLGLNYGSLAESVERISTGHRVNTSKDDAAGLAVRELMQADIMVLRQGVRNTADAVSMLQTMEGAMTTLDGILIRMRELAEQASTDSYSTSQRQIMSNEFQEMAAEIDRIAASAEFNSIQMLNSASGSVSLHFKPGSSITVSTVDVTASALGVDSASVSIAGSDGTAARLALTALTTAIEAKDSARAYFGSTMNRLENTEQVLRIEMEATMASESRITDVDIGTELARLTRNQVLSRANVAMLSQANMLPSMALSLLNG